MIGFFAYGGRRWVGMLWYVYACFFYFLISDRFSCLWWNKVGWYVILLMMGGCMSGWVGITWGGYDSMSDLGEIRVYQRADFQSGSRVLKKVF